MERAQGLLMQRDGVIEREVSRRLRRAAVAVGGPLAAVARDVAQTETLA